MFKYVGDGVGAG